MKGLLVFIATLIGYFAMGRYSFTEGPIGSWLIEVERPSSEAVEAFCQSIAVPATYSIRYSPGDYKRAETYEGREDSLCELKKRITPQVGKSGASMTEILDLKVTLNDKFPWNTGTISYRTESLFYKAKKRSQNKEIYYFANEYKAAIHRGIFGDYKFTNYDATIKIMNKDEYEKYKASKKQKRR